MIENFSEAGLRPELLQAIEQLGYLEPTPIQKQAIPAILTSGKDLIALAQTGTGKTAAFGFPILHKTDLSDRRIQTIILCPTRELCVQISKDLESYSTHLKGIKTTAVYGGANIQPQIKSLREGVHIVVGTPGRVLDLIRRKLLILNAVKWVVLDEADEMLNMGFQEDLDQILAETPQDKNTYLFSATMPKEIKRIAEKYMKDVTEITIGQRNAGAENVTHDYYVVHARDRYVALKRLADINPSIYGIVFCRTRQETKEVADKLISDAYNADALHGDLSQAQRDHVMHRFRSKHLQILVATDVAARGLDVDDLTHVINYNLPDDLEVYVHRSGRTGRAGKSGVCLSILHTRETSKVRDLEKMTKKKFQRKQVPNGQEICEKQLFKLVDKVENIQVDEKRIEQFIPAIFQKLEWLSREQLIKHFVSVEFNRFLEYYQDAPDLNIQVEKRRDSNDAPSSDRRRGQKTKFSRFFINLGSKNNIAVVNLIGLINEKTKNRDITIGKIDIMRKFSFFEVDSKFENEVLTSFKDAIYDDVPISIEVAESFKGEQFSRDGREGREGRDNRENRGSRDRDFNRDRDNSRPRTKPYSNNSRDDSRKEETSKKSAPAKRKRNKQRPF